MTPESPFYVCWGGGSSADDWKLTGSPSWLRTFKILTLTLRSPCGDVPLRQASVAHRVLPACLSLLLSVSLQDLIKLGLRRLRYQFCAPSRISSARGSIASGEAKSITASFATCGVPLAVSISSQNRFRQHTQHFSISFRYHFDYSSRIRISHLITTWAVYFLESSHPMGLGASSCCA